MTVGPTSWSASPTPSPPLNSIPHALGVNMVTLERLFVRCPNLRALNVNRSASIECLSHILMRAPQLVDLGTGPDWRQGLEAVGSTCKDLQELRVYPSNFLGAPYRVTEEGLIVVSIGFPKLNSLLYFCEQMANSALIIVAKNCPNFIWFNLFVMYLFKPDPIMNQPLDEGFGVIVQACKGLKRSLSGLLTDRVFLYIEMYIEQLEMPSIAFAGETDKGMVYVLNGCKKSEKAGDMRLTLW